MNRRDFLKGMSGILVAGVAPAIVRADSLMRIVPRDTTALLGQTVMARWDLFVFKDGVLIPETFYRWPS